MTTTNKYKNVQPDLQVDSMQGPKQVGIAGKLFAGALALVTSAGILAGSSYVVNVYTSPKSAQASELTTTVKQPSVELLSRADVELLARNVADRAADAAYNHAEERRQADMKLITDKLESISTGMVKQAEAIDAIRTHRR